MPKYEIPGGEKPILVEDVHVLVDGGDPLNNADCVHVGKVKSRVGYPPFSVSATNLSRSSAPGKVYLRRGPRPGPTK